MNDNLCSRLVDSSIALVVNSTTVNLIPLSLKTRFLDVIAFTSASSLAFALAIGSLLGSPSSTA
jgi:hypothetical protein